MKLFGKILFLLISLTIMVGAIMAVIEGGGKGAVGGAIIVGGIVAAFALTIYAIIEDA